MNSFALASNGPWLVLEVIVAFAGGASIGILHFGLLRRLAKMFLFGGTAGRVIALYFLRFGTTGAVLYLAARLGAWPLLAALAGILATRHLVVNGIGERQ